MPKHAKMFIMDKTLKGFNVSFDVNWLIFFTITYTSTFANMHNIKRPMLNVIDIIIIKVFNGGSNTTNRLFFFDIDIITHNQGCCFLKSCIIAMTW